MRTAEDCICGVKNYAYAIRSEMLMRFVVSS